MSKKSKKTIRWKVARDAKTGKFISMSEAKSVKKEDLSLSAEFFFIGERISTSTFNSEPIVTTT